MNMIRTMKTDHSINLQKARGGRSSSMISLGLSMRVLIVALVFNGVMGHCSTLADFATVDTSRDIASLRFPIVSNEQDEEDMVVEYMPYLQFVTAVGNQVDAQSSKRLAQTYQNLRKRSRASAALFLKGLRYEMIQRVELSGWNPHSLSTNSPEMRAFVGRYLKVWLREADEHLFRSYSNEIASRRNKSDE